MTHGSDRSGRRSGSGAGSCLHILQESKGLALSDVVYPEPVAGKADLPLTPSLLERCLQDQQTLRAAEKFSQHHARSTGSLQEKYYRDLIPLTEPREGEQYAFEVDLDLCTGCKSCVSGCNAMNGLNPDEAWRDVGLLKGETAGQGTLQHVTTSCHHCLEPACAEGCPVNAYEKDPLTGIVKHLDDQCIGCQYCTLTCPYDVPEYSKELSIVRKCDMCSDRLAEGEAPACVQACPTRAIQIRVVKREEMIRLGDGGPLVPGAPPSDITFPGTVFKSTRGTLRSMLPVDFYTPQVEHNHLPLMVMLVTMQLASGVCILDWVLRTFLLGRSLGALEVWVAWTCFVACALALGASFFHLGRPLYAFRVVVGLGHSWLSREIVAFGAFVSLALMNSLVRVGALSGGEVVPPALGALELLVPGAALLTNFCSIMVYHVTRRPFWDAIRTGPKFMLTGLLLGASCLLAMTCVALWVSGDGDDGVTVWLAVLIRMVPALLIVKLVMEFSVLMNLKTRNNSPLKRTALLHRTVMWRQCGWRVGCGLVGGFVAPVLIELIGNTERAPWSVCVLIACIGVVLCVAGELLERYLFFAAAVALKMPGRRVG